ncbi:hypothetical protein SLA2020_004090 [Shorea laevis]
MLLPLGFAEPEPLCFGADLACEIELRGVVDFISWHAAGFVDDESELGRGKGGAIVKEEEKVRFEVLKNDLARRGSEEHPDSG